MTAKPCFEHLILDAGPLISDDFDPLLGRNLYTVPEVIAEIRDAASRARLNKLNLKIRPPTALAFKTVVEFAKKTGDYAALSKADLRVVALALTLEIEFNGTGRVRTEPLKPSISGGKGAPKNKHAGDASMAKDEANVEAASIKSELVGLIEKGDRKDADQGWITPESIKSIDIDPEPCLSSSPPVVGIACVTSDFALQNVLLQMRLQLLTPNGVRIDRLKHWLLRCHGCFTITKSLERRFCEKCGGPTLIRTSYAIDASGEVRLFLRKDFHYNTRGSIYSIPLSKGGRTNDDLMLREDQKEYIRAVKHAQFKEKKAMKDPDADFMGLFGKLKIDETPRPVIGHGRRNPNEARRRRK